MKTIKHHGYIYKVIGETEHTITAVRVDAITSILQVSFIGMQVHYQTVWLRDKYMDMIEKERMSRYATV